MELSAEDVIWTKGLRKSQADGIFALRIRAHEIAARLDEFWDGLPLKPQAMLAVTVPTMGPLSPDDLGNIAAWANYEADRWDEALDGMEGNERAVLIDLRDECLALARWIREDGRA